MSQHTPEHERDRDEDGFGTVDRTEEQEERAQVDLDQPESTDDVPWSPPTSQPIHSEFDDDPAEETIDQRIAQEVPEQGTAYGAPEPGGVLGGADDPAGTEGPRVGGDDPDAIPAVRDVLGTESGL